MAVIHLDDRKEKRFLKGTMAMKEQPLPLAPDNLKHALNSLGFSFVDTLILLFLQRAQIAVQFFPPLLYFI